MWLEILTEKLAAITFSLVSSLKTDSVHFLLAATHAVIGDRFWPLRRQLHF